MIEGALIVLGIGVDHHELEAVGQRAAVIEAVRGADPGRRVRHEHGRRFVLLAQRLGALIIGGRTCAWAAEGTGINTRAAEGTEINTRATEGTESTDSLFINPPSRSRGIVVDTGQPYWLSVALLRPLRRATGNNPLPAALDNAAKSASRCRGCAACW